MRVDEATCVSGAVIIAVEPPTEQLYSARRAVAGAVCDVLAFRRFLLHAVRRQCRRVTVQAALTVSCWWACESVSVSMQRLPLCGDAARCATDCIQRLPRQVCLQSEAGRPRSELTAIDRCTQAHTALPTNADQRRQRRTSSAAAAAAWSTVTMASRERDTDLRTSHTALTTHRTLLAYSRLTSLQSSTRIAQLRDGPGVAHPPF